MELIKGLLALAVVLGVPFLVLSAIGFVIAILLSFIKDDRDDKWAKVCTERDKDFKDFMTGKGKYRDDPSYYVHTGLCSSIEEAEEMIRMRNMGKGYEWEQAKKKAESENDKK